MSSKIMARILKRCCQYLENSEIETDHFLTTYGSALYSPTRLISDVVSRGIMKATPLSPRQPIPEVSQPSSAAPINGNGAETSVTRNGDRNPTAPLISDLSQANLTAGFICPSADRIGSGRPDWTKPDMIQWVEIERVLPDPHNPRRQASAIEMGELIESIKLQGFRDPIKVRPLDDPKDRERCMVKGGHRRLYAARNIGLRHVPVIIVRAAASKVGQLLDLLADNSHRADFAPIDKAKAFQTLIDNDMTATAIADKLKITPTTVTTSLSLLKLPSEVQTHINSGAISVRNGAQLARLTNPEQVLSVASQLIARTIKTEDLGSIVSGKQAIKAKTNSTSTARITTQIYRTNQEITVSSGATVSIKAFGRMTSEQMCSALREAIVTLGG